MVDEGGSPWLERHPTTNMTAFVQTYLALPPELRETLLSHDIEPLRICADVYVEIYEEHGGPHTMAKTAATKTKQPDTTQHYTT